MNEFNEMFKNILNTRKFYKTVYIFETFCFLKNV